MSRVWLGAAALLALPWVAMRFTDEVAWDAFDFLVFGAMLAVACTAWELLRRMSHALEHRLASALAIGASFVLVWACLAVGFIGHDGDPANLLYAAVIVTGAVGASLARLQPAGMARTLLAMAAVQAAIGALALAAGLGQPASGPAEIVALNGLFAAAFVAAAWLYRRAAERAPR